jgi:hypothetical protein
MGNSIQIRVSKQTIDEIKQCKMFYENQMKQNNINHELAVNDVISIACRQSLGKITKIDEK